MLLLPLRNQRALCLPRGETVFMVLSVGDFSTFFPFFVLLSLFFFWLLVSRLLFVSVMFLFILCSFFFPLLVKGEGALLAFIGRREKQQKQKSTKRRWL